jgi:hypothetical protein
MMRSSCCCRCRSATVLAGGAGTGTEAGTGTGAGAGAGAGAGSGAAAMAGLSAGAGDAARREGGGTRVSASSIGPTHAACTGWGRLGIGKADGGCGGGGRGPLGRRRGRWGEEQARRIHTLVPLARLAHPRARPATPLWPVRLHRTPHAHLCLGVSLFLCPCLSLCVRECAWRRHGPFCEGAPLCVAALDGPNGPSALGREKAYQRHADGADWTRACSSVSAKGEGATWRTPAYCPTLAARTRGGSPLCSSISFCLPQSGRSAGRAHTRTAAAG